MDYSSSIIAVKIPLDGDNWTEHGDSASWWSVINVNSTVIDRPLGGIVGSYAINMSITDNGTDGFCVGLDLPTTVNITGYEKLEFWIEYHDFNVNEIPVPNIKNIYLYEGMDSVSIAPYLILNAAGWLHFAVNLDEFSKNLSFDPSFVSGIEWSYDWFPRIYNITDPKGFLFDGVHFEKNETKHDFNDSGVWYSDWIYLNGVGDKVTINTKYPQNVSIYISSDNSTWYQLSSNGTSDISQYGFKKVILRVDLKKTSNGDTSVVNSIVITSTSTIIPTIIPPQTPVIDPIISYGIMIGLASVVGVLTILLVRKKTTSYVVKP